MGVCDVRDFAVHVGTILTTAREWVVSTPDSRRPAAAADSLDALFADLGTDRLPAAK